MFPKNDFKTKDINSPESISLSEMKIRKFQYKHEP